jgi:homoserine dehydrogenase
MEDYKIGIIGLGTVGGGVYQQLVKKASLIKQRTGVRLVVKAVCDKNKEALKAAGVTQEKIVLDYERIIKDPAIDCVVELIGGTKLAKKIIIDALKNGKNVVTANKALLAEHGQDIFETAKANGKNVYFEASVGGGIPIIKGLNESLVSNRVTTILSIINGTCNYILSKMTLEKMDFKDALRIAQEKGYAEADPTLDIEGIDAAHKIAILAQLAFGKKVNFHDISCQGISKIQLGDIAFADQLGYVVKLLAIAKKTKAGVEVRVQPTLISKDHILANVNDSYNAVYLECDEVENMLFYGRGAGARPTASAVVSDLVDLARMTKGEKQACEMPVLETMEIMNISAIQSRYFLRFSVIDKPGVLAKIADVFGQFNVSISDVIQQERKVGHVVPLVFLTHETSENNIVQAVNRINQISVIKGSSQVLRIEE